MREVRCGLSKEEFDSVMAVEPGKRSGEVKKYLPIHILCGYGYYGLIRMVQENENYYAEVYAGSTCD